MTKTKHPSMVRGRGSREGSRHSEPTKTWQARLLLGQGAVGWGLPRSPSTAAVAALGLGALHEAVLPILHEGWGQPWRPFLRAWSPGPPGAGQVSADRPEVGLTALHPGRAQCCSASPLCRLLRDPLSRDRGDCPLPRHRGVCSAPPACLACADRAWALGRSPLPQSLGPPI